MITRSLVFSAFVAAVAATAAAQPAKKADDPPKKPPCEPQPDCLVLALPAPPASPFGGERDTGIMINGFDLPSRNGASSTEWVK